MTPIDDMTGFIYAVKLHIVADADSNPILLPDVKEEIALQIAAA